jgi:hypothetical protein
LTIDAADSQVVGNWTAVRCIACAVAQCSARSTGCATCLPTSHSCAEALQRKDLTPSSLDWVRNIEHGQLVSWSTLEAPVLAMFVQFTSSVDARKSPRRPIRE